MVKKLPIVTLLGKSGCGKDTQGDILVNQHGFTMINSGVILRTLRESIPKLKKDSVERYEAKEIQHIINAGLFTPTLTIACQWRLPLLEIVKNPKKIRGVVFTGSPRKLAEALIIHEFLQNWPDAKNNFNLYPIEIKLSEKEAFRRLLSRRQCEKCKKIFSASPEHLVLRNCDSCCGKLFKRQDDTKEGIRSRMNEFNKYVVPVLRYFKDEDLLRFVNGEQNIGNVHEDIVKILSL